MKNSEYVLNRSGKNNYSYPQKKVRNVANPAYDVYRKTMYNISIEQGLFTWIVGSDIGYITSFFDILNEWSVKTYEGKNVTLGFVINPDIKDCANSIDWLPFMKEDTVAVITDCIHSIIELDSECKMVNYLSISENNKLPECELIPFVPIRFTHIIKNYVTGNKVGVLLLNNGDIILAKKGSVRFVKRNNHWLNLSYKAFYNVLQPFIEKNKMDPNIIQNVFASVLDVSFSHAGGIIAIVNTIDDNPQKNFLSTDILNPCENLLTNDGLDDEKNALKSFIKNHKKSEKYLTTKEKAENQKKISERKKIILKREILSKLVSDNNFATLDRKLRSELMSLDGACILDTRGNILSFGAIIKNDSGSSGGGRSAAAKKLSEYGMAIKISTDGYIELYLDRIPSYIIK